MQILSPEQKQILLDCGHDWKNDGLNELPVFYIRENKWACNCRQEFADDLIGGIDLSQHQDTCILKTHFSLRQVEKVE